MSDTHPNAFRMEAEEKRQEAARLIQEANDLELQANNQEVAKHPELAQPAQEPAPEKPADDDKKKSVFTKK